MPKQTKVVVAQRLQQALAALNENELNSFLAQMAALGEWLQKNKALPQYKNHEHALQQSLTLLQPPSTATYCRRPEQTLALKALENAWQDSSLARLQALHFVHEDHTPGEPHTCQILQLTEEPYWRLIPFDAEGNRQAPLDLSNLDSDVAELLNKKRQGQSFEPARLIKALRRANIGTVDQRNLRAQAELSKESRQRIRLGLEAFKLLCPEDKVETEVSLSAQLVEQEPTSAELAQLPSNTYLVLRPRPGKKGRIWLLSARGKREITSPALSELLTTPSFLSETSILRLHAEKIFDKKIRQALLDYHFQKLDEAAVNAIRNYKTPWQKVMSVFEITVAALASLNYGAISVIATLVGLFVAAGITWTSPLLALGGVLLLAGAVILPFFSTWTNWKFFSTYLSNFFGKIGSEYQEIRSPQKKALFWGVTFFALATGMASGALAYTATIALPALLGLSSIGFIFPPLGVAFAVAIAISQSVSFTRSFCDILRKENSWKTFKKPFTEVSALLRNADANPGRRVAIWIMVGGLTVLAVLGLAMSCFTSTRSVGKFFIDQFMTAPKKALIWGIAISAVASFISRIYVTISSAMHFSMWMCKRWLQAAKALPLKKAISVASDSVLSGLFYLWSMINLSQKTPEDLQHDADIHLSGLGPVPTALLATAGLLTAGTRALAINMKHAGKPSDPTEEAREAAATQRVRKLQSHYLEKNPHFIFATQAELKDAEPRYEALHSVTLTRT